METFLFTGNAKMDQCNPLYSNIDDMVHRLFESIKMGREPTSGESPSSILMV